MSAMKSMGMTKLILKKEGFELHLESATISEKAEIAPSTVYPRDKKVLSEPLEAVGEAEASHRYVVSPIVGTFYSSESQDVAPYVKVGDTVEEDTIVCIVEAMKVMNEVKAGIKGVVDAVLVDSGHSVEFGTKMLRVV